MEITIRQLNSGALKIFVEGKFNALTVFDFRRELEKIPQGMKIILDFSGVNYISSAGLSEILICRKKFSDMQIENMRREIYMLFLLTGFDEFIPITILENSAKKKFSAANMSFKKFLRDQAIFSGEEVAVTYAGEEYTWQDLEHGSKVMANELFKSGVRQGERMALCGERTVNWLQAFFAIQKIGAVAVLVDSNLDTKKITALVAEADAKFFCYGEIPAANEKIFCYEIQKFSGGKIQTFYSVRDDLNFKTRFAGKSKFHVIVRDEDPAVMINGEIFSAREIFNGGKEREIFGVFEKIFGR